MNYDPTLTGGDIVPPVATTADLEFPGGDAAGYGWEYCDGSAYSDRERNNAAGRGRGDAGGCGYRNANGGG